MTKRKRKKPKQHIEPSIVGVCSGCGKYIKRKKYKNFIFLETPIESHKGEHKSFLIHNKCLKEFLPKLMKEFEITIQTYKNIIYEMESMLGERWNQKKE